jgi:hypothetical protein
MFRKRILSGIRDLDLEILNNLEDKDLFNFCLSNVEAGELCRDDNFWRKRFYKRYISLFYDDQEFIEKIKSGKWKTFYLKIITETGKYKDNPWNFFNKVEWNLNTNKFVENDLGDLENFYFLDLGKKAILELPIDRYEDLELVSYEIKGEPFLTPAHVLEFIYQFYSEPVTVENFRLHLEEENPYAEDYSEEDVIAGNVLRKDLIGERYFEGFQLIGHDFREVPIYQVILGS